MKHSTCTEENVDTSIVNVSASSCDVHRGGDASIDWYVQCAKTDISNHIDDARAPFGAFETFTCVILHVLSIAYGVGDVRARDVDMCAHLRVNCDAGFDICTYLRNRAASRLKNEKMIHWPITRYNTHIYTPLTRTHSTPRVRTTTKSPSAPVARSPSSHPPAHANDVRQHARRDERGQAQRVRRERFNRQVP